MRFLALLIVAALLVVFLIAAITDPVSRRLAKKLADVQARHPYSAAWLTVVAGRNRTSILMVDARTIRITALDGATELTWRREDLVAVHAAKVQRGALARSGLRMHFQDDDLELTFLSRSGLTASSGIAEQVALTCNPGSSDTA